MTTAHIISHATCPDGFGSAYMLDHVLRKSRPDIELEIVHWPVGYEHEMFKGGADLSFTRDALIYIVDFCPPANWLAQVTLLAQSVFLLDHHQTAADEIIPELERLMQEPNTYHGNRYEIFDSVDAWENGPSARFEIVVDQTHSGVGLVAQYARVCGVKPEHILWFWPEIEDRDLWRFNLLHSKPITTALSAMPYTFEAWAEANAMEVDELVAIGQAIEGYRDQLIDACTAKPFKLLLHDSGWVARACAAPYMIGSDCAGKLAEQTTLGLGAYVIVHGDDVQIGLRSTPDGPDVAQIAAKYGGGGHRHAAGLRVSHAQLAKMMRP